MSTIERDEIHKSIMKKIEYVAKVATCSTCRNFVTIVTEGTNIATGACKLFLNVNFKVDVDSTCAHHREDK